MAGTGLVKFVACTDSVGPKLLLTGGPWDSHRIRGRPKKTRQLGRMSIRVTGTCS